MVRDSKLGIVSTSMMVFAVILGASNRSGVSLGDTVFNAVGIPSWSNGYSGFHFTLLLSLILFILGVVDARKVFSRKKLVILIFVCLILVPPITLQGRICLLRLQSGLKTVEYNMNPSHLDFSSTEDRKLNINGTLILTNYGKTPITFGIKLPNTERTQRFGISREIDLKGIEKSGTLEHRAGERKEIEILTVLSESVDYNGKGVMNGPDLLLFNQSELRMVGNNK